MGSADVWKGIAGRRNAGNIQKPVWLERGEQEGEGKALKPERAAEGGRLAQRFPRQFSLRSFNRSTFW